MVQAAEPSVGLKSVQGTVLVESFGLQSTVSSVTLTSGGNTSIAVTVSATNTFAGTVSFSVPSAPAGLTFSFSPPATTGAAATTLTITASTTIATGNYAVTIRGASGTVNQEILLTVIIATPPSACASLPSGWTCQDIGTTYPGTGATYRDGKFTVTSKGYPINGTSDGFHYVYQQLSGSGTIVVQVTDAPTGTLPRIGIMVRKDLSANAAHVSVLLDGNTTAALRYRTATGGGTSSVTGSSRLQHGHSILAETLSPA